jgi:hypothetical protein
MQYNNLRRSFLEIDPFFTDNVLREEFEETLLDLCPELNRQELDYICDKYGSQNINDSRINYINFLAPYSSIQQNRDKNAADHLKESGDQNVSARLDMNDTITLKLRMNVN